MNDWRDHLCRLADELTRSDQLPDTWSETFHSVPRHVFVPRYYEQDGTGQWRAIDGTNPADTDRWLDGVYSDRTLITTLQEDHGPWGTQHIPISSSTLPSLMLRMLHELDITDDSTVLEIGTGTGYNAALLSARLGAHHVYSVDLRDELVNTARERLATLGYHPTLATTDGADGLPEFGPYARIVATCAERYVPPVWLDQLAPEGVILTDIKGGINAGNLVKLTRPNARPYAHGRFLAWWAGFMTMAHNHTHPPPKPLQRLATVSRTTHHSPTVLDEPVFAFIAQAHLPADIQLRRRLNPEHCTLLTETGTGNWTSIEHHHTSDGYHVEHTGTDHWRAVEDAHDLWLAQKQPYWDRFGLTLTPQGQQVWLDEPDGPYSWPIAL